MIAIKGSFDGTCRVAGRMRREERGERGGVGIVHSRSCCNQSSRDHEKDDSETGIVYRKDELSASWQNHEKQTQTYGTGSFSSASSNSISRSSYSSFSSYKLQPDRHDRKKNISVNSLTRRSTEWQVKDGKGELTCNFLSSSWILDNRVLYFENALIRCWSSAR